jgi:hypothetical protein
MILLGALFTVAATLSAASQGVFAKGPQPKTEFTIETHQTVGTWLTSGKFRASGAVKDGGDAVTSFMMYPDYDLVLLGRRGTMMIQFDYGLSYRTWIDETTVITEGVVLFIIDGTDEHEGLIGTMGTASVVDEATDGYDLDGDGVYGKLHWTLQGSLAP